MGPYVSRAFKTYTDDKLALFASTSYQMMSTDIKYDGFKMFYDEVKAKNTDFILNIAVAIPGGKDRTEDKKISRAALIWALESEAIQIERTPNVTARFITDAGFEVRNMERKSTKTPVVITEIGVPQNFVAANINKPHIAKLKWDEVANAINYGIRYKPLAETVWQDSIFNHLPEYTFNNLQSGIVYEFEVYAMGPNGLISENATTVPIYVS